MLMDEISLILIAIGHALSIVQKYNSALKLESQKN